METTSAQILNAVKTDDIKLFSYLTEQKKGLLSLSFGRFPILSLCYLYKAAKITAAYEKLLLQTTAYVIEEEDFASYKRFRVRAKTCMRLYRGKGLFVTPLEMLAVLGETYKLVYLYPKITKSPDLADNIKKIYRILHKREAASENGNLKIKRNNLTVWARAAVAAILIVAVLMIALPSAAIANVTMLTGDGSPENPYKISGEAQLASAFGSGNLYYKLTKDIVLGSAWTPANLSANLDGGGHTVYLGDKAVSGFIGVLSGTINNIRFVFADFNLSIDTNKGMLITNITGSAVNIRTKITASLTEAVSDKDIYVSCFALENSGTVSNCTVSYNVKFEGNGEKDAYLAGLVAWNRGTVDACSSAEGSVFETVTVDASGLVTENGEKGNITSCHNNAHITQTSDVELWSPNASGIAGINLGTIRDCTNNAIISSASTSLTEDANVYSLAGGISSTNNGEISVCLNYGAVSASSINLTSYAGGIASINNKSITKSKNDAKIQSHSTRKNAFAGGVAAYNYTNASVIDNSCSYGQIQINNEVYQDKYDYISFAGGIAGRNDGEVINSYSCSTFALETEEGSNYFLGGIMGLASYNAKGQNNYYLARANVSYGNAAIMNYINITEGNDVGVTLLSGIEQLKEKEVYWG